MTTSELEINDNIIKQVRQQYQKFTDNLQSRKIQFGSDPSAENKIELEFRLGSFDRPSGHSRSKFNASQSLTQFKYIIDHLRNLDSKSFTEQYSLDIRTEGQYDAFRLTIKDLSNIKNYCRQSNLNLLDSKFLECVSKDKHHSSKSDFPEYNLRCDISLERKLPDTNIQPFKLVIDDAKITKKYRYKHRYSFILGHIRYDLTTVKNGQGQTFQNSKTLDADEQYEVEMEVLDPETFFKQENSPILIHQLITWSQMSFDIIKQSERDQILLEYMRLSFPNEKSECVDPRKCFIGIDVMPLEIDKLKKIVQGYSVTDKADGERCLLLISKQQNNKVYLIDNMMNIKYTGLQIKHPTYDISGTIFDGEMVKRNNVEESYKYLIFDCFFFQSRDLRSLPLYQPSVGASQSATPSSDQITFRYQVVQVFDNLYKNITSTTSTTNLEIGIKIYQFQTDRDKTIFQLAKTVYDAPRDYNCDGLIFTPYNQEYPKVQLSSSQYIPYSQLNVYKWKDLNQLSIDFLVYFVNSLPNYDPEIKSRFIQARLQVSDSQKGIIDFIPNTRLTKDHKPDPNFNLVNLKLNTYGLPFAKNGDIIYHQGVYEFIYDQNQPNGFKWVPLRFRPDKSDPKNPRPNAHRTALRNWALIIHPITREMITGEVSTEKYYVRVDSTQLDLVIPMRKYHNLIKRYIIKKYCEQVRQELNIKKLQLLDPACGQGGDLSKWHDARIDYVLGIDLDQSNIDEAINRYSIMLQSTKKSKMRFMFPKKIDLICGDSSKEIKTGAAGMTRENQEKLKTIIQQMGKNLFHLVSCQFAFHYFTKSEQVLDAFLTNVRDNLVEGGYFIGTTLNGRIVFDKLISQDTIQGKKKSSKDEETVIWSITKKYTEPTFENFGQAISVFNISIGQEISEYLVNFEYLKSKVETYGLSFIEIKNFEDFYQTTHQIANQKDKQIIQEMSEAEKEYSKMHVYFILQKKKSSSQSETTKPKLSIQQKQVGVIEPAESAASAASAASSASTEPVVSVEPVEPATKKKLKIKRKPSLTPAPAHTSST
ncbi:MAG: hypothetical protein ABIN35_00325 [candidate division WOR-3 bacterium]